MSERKDGGPWVAEGKCVYAGWEEIPEENRSRFVAKIEFSEPPHIPFKVAWNWPVYLLAARDGKDDV